MKPSNFIIHPYSSVMANWESEQVARNIMIILKRTGNEWRSLSWEEYKTERQKDGDFSESEKSYFDGVIDYCQSSLTAILFSPAWRMAK